MINLIWIIFVTRQKNIKLVLTLSYLKQEAQSFHLNLWIPSIRLSTRFDNELAIKYILVLSVHFILQDIVTIFS